MGTDQPAVLVSIPVRGNSRRIPNKWQAMVGGKTLLRRAIDQGLRVGDYVAVSTDSQDIVDYVHDVALELGHARLDAWKVPWEIADTDIAETQERAVLPLAVQLFGLDAAATLVVRLFITQPLRRDEDIYKGVALQQEHGRTWIAFTRPSRHRGTEIEYPEGAVCEWSARVGMRRDDWRADDHTARMQVAGVAYIGPFISWMRSGSQPDEGFGTWYVDPWHALDIDEPDDLVAAQALWAARDRLTGS